MKKNNESFAAGKYDTSEVTRRLYRGALDAARRLEEFLRGNPYPDVLGPDVTAMRMRLKDYCERLLFSDSQDFSRKAEELLWRKVYYEPLQMYKQRRKKSATGGALESSDLLCGWLRSGVGHYQHLLLRLQAEFQLPQDSILAPQCPWRHRGLRKERWSRHQRSVCVHGREDWATQTAHRCLMCLGDLSRYLSECGDPGSDHLSERYYRQAFLLLPSLGMPFNQMGTLAAFDQNRGCHALYFYLRCLSSPQSFDGAEGNIQRVFEKNQPLYEEIASSSEKEDATKLIPVLRKLCIHFLKLAELFFKQQETMLANLCQEVLQDFNTFLSLIEVPFNQNCPSSAAPTSSEDEQELDEENPGLLTFRLGVVALMCFARLQSQRSPLVSAAAAFVLSFLSQVLQHSLVRLQTALFLTSDVMSNHTVISPLRANSPAVNGTSLSGTEKEISYSPGVEDEGTRTRSTSGTLTPIAAANGASSDETASKHPHVKLEHGNSKLSDTSLGHPKRHTSVLGHLRRRRRRNASSTSQDDSEVSNEEGEACESDVDNGITSDISETGSLHGSEGSLTEHEEEDEPADILTISLTDNLPPANEVGDHKNIPECDNSSPESDTSLTQKSHHQLKWWETLEVLYQERFQMALIKVLSHWLACHPDILSACAQSTHSLWKHFADLLNVLIKAESSLLNTEETLSSQFSLLKCPRPSRTGSNKTGSEDGLNNYNNNINSQNESSESEALCAIEKWAWSGWLPEDVELQQLPFLVVTENSNQSSAVQKKRSCQKSVLDARVATTVSVEQLSKCEQVFGRIQCLLHFGLVHSFPFKQQKSLTANNLGKNGFVKSPKTDCHDQLFCFDPVRMEFTMFEPTQGDVSNQAKTVQNQTHQKNTENSSSPSHDITSDIDGQRKQLMRNMAHLWLKAEVQDLEGRTGSPRGGKRGNHTGPGSRHTHYPVGGRQGSLQGGCLPPYLVPDTGALCHQLPALKQLLSARRFIIILPSSVISSLDELKRQSAYAREAIRWIEAELRAGSRFLRSQKSQERLTLMPMKYPKRKEKEAWDFFQVLECCNYLNKSNSHGRATSAPLVTLVTGGNQFLPLNGAAVASSAGVSMESVEDFLKKWRNSLKS